LTLSSLLPLGIEVNFIALAYSQPYSPSLIKLKQSLFRLSGAKVILFSTGASGAAGAGTAKRKSTPRDALTISSF
jgi:hypothetical protein